MKVWNRLADIPRLVRPVVTIGNFDGVHTGHQRIFDEMKAIAAADNADSLVITFHDHPRRVLYPETNIRLLSTSAERERVIAGTGVGHLLVVGSPRSWRQCMRGISWSRCWSKNWECAIL
jgi:FAD synthase